MMPWLLLPGAHFVQLCDQRNLPMLFLQVRNRRDQFTGILLF
jgi:hypothetical protein